MKNLNVRLFLKVFFLCVAAVWMFLALLHFALGYLAENKNIKEKIISIIKNQISADVVIGKMSAGIFDIKLQDVKISSQNQIIASADVLYVRFSLIHLIKGHLRVKDFAANRLNINIAKDKNGKFNFDKILQSPVFAEGSAEDKAAGAANTAKGVADNSKMSSTTGAAKDGEEENNVLDILVNKFQLNECRINYSDEQNNIRVCVDKISFDMDNLTLQNPFEFNSYINLSVKMPELNIENLHASLRAVANLKSLNLSQAYADIKFLGFRFKDTAVITKGKISNFENPQIDLKTKISDLSSQTIKPFVAGNTVNGKAVLGAAEGTVQKDASSSAATAGTGIPDFFISEINTDTSLKLNLKKNLADIKKFNINIFDSNIESNGKIDFAKDLKYDINLTIKLVLDKLALITDMVKVYSPAGEIDAWLNITSSENIIKGNVSLADVAAFLPQFGTISEINTAAEIKSFSDIELPSLTGKINSYPFKSSALYRIESDGGHIKFNFYADRVYGKMTKEYERSLNKKQEQNDKEKNSQKISKEAKIDKRAEDKNAAGNKNVADSKNADGSSKFPPLRVEADFKVKDMNVPYFMGKNIDFTVDMHNVTPELDDIEGNITLTTADGTIKDIYKLTEANAVAKGVFLSLKIVSNVINALNVLDVLNSLGSAVFSSKKDNNNTEISDDDAHDRKQKLDGKIDYISFITSMDFEQGKGVLKNCSFVSNLMSFRGTGSIDFRKDLVNMSVNAAPGRHEEKSGIMPLKIKIKGTTDNPEGSMSVLGSVTSLVGDTLTKNVVSGGIKSVFSKIFGKKKDKKDKKR